MAFTRRSFLTSATVSAASVLLWSPLARAAQATADPATAAALVLNVLTAEPQNALAPQDWASVARLGLTSGFASDRPTFTALSQELPDLASMSTAQLRGALLGRLHPGYAGPRTVTRTAIQAEIVAIQQSIATPQLMTAPTFDLMSAPSAVRASLQPAITDVQLRAARIASNAIAAASHLASTVNGVPVIPLGLVI